MIYKNQILVFIFSSLIGGFFLLSIPEAGFSQVATCTILITKDADPADNTEFPFIFTRQGSMPINFTLQDTQNAQFAMIPINTPVIIEESVPLGWSLANIECNTADNINFTFVDSTVEINCLVAGEITCTFFDRLLPPPPIPTLNQWGMIIMAGVLGLFAVIGLFVMRRSGVVETGS